jgi:hypothetical protein
MIRLPEDTLDSLERAYPGIREQIVRFDGATLPPCTLCGSRDTAEANAGVMSRTINIAAATTKFKLIPNGPRPANYFCNMCCKFFNEKH